MMRRLWYWLRDVLWTAVISAALAIVAILCAVYGLDTLAVVLGLSSISLAVLSQRN
jgi:hypothetical protein